MDVLKREARGRLSCDSNLSRYSASARSTEPVVSDPVTSRAFEVIEGLFVAVPGFIGSQIDNVLTAVLSPEVALLAEDKHSDGFAARASLLSTAAKKLPAKTMFPAIIRQYSSIDGTQAQVSSGRLSSLYDIY